jgi:hypothetical protein
MARNDDRTAGASLQGRLAIVQTQAAALNRSPVTTGAPIDEDGRTLVLKSTGGPAGSPPGGCAAVDPAIMSAETKATATTAKAVHLIA